MNSPTTSCCERCKDYEPCYRISCRCHVSENETKDWNLAKNEYFQGGSSLNAERHFGYKVKNETDGTHRTFDGVQGANAMPDPLEEFRERFGHIFNGMYKELSQPLKQWIIQYGEKRYQEGVSDGKDGMDDTNDVAYESGRADERAKIQKIADDIATKYSTSSSCRNAFDELAIAFSNHD